MTGADDQVITVCDISRCFEGAVPAVIATAGADGTPNVTYLSRVQMVDDERIALSNQFFSKTAKNLAENPRASVLVVDPTSFDQYRMTVAYERTERRGPVFERLRDDIAALAALEGMEDVFKLRSADIYRVLDIERMPCGVALVPEDTDASPASPQLDALAVLATRMSRCADLDTLLSTAVDGLADLFGYEHSSVLLLDEDGRGLYTIASHGYDSAGVGSEIIVGEGMVGMAAARAQPLRIGNLGQMNKYSRTVRASFESAGAIAPGREIEVPGLPDAQSRIAVPAMSFGQLVGVLVIETPRVVAYSAQDQAILTVVASLVAEAVESERAVAGADSTPPRRPDPSVERRGQPAPATVPPAQSHGTSVRYFPVDGSTFLDGDYLIKGVAGRILWSLLGQNQREGRIDFTNREVRLDATLELPAFRDNFENRLILLKRRLDEREAPVRIEKTGRGRFRLLVDGPLRLDLVETLA